MHGLDEEAGSSMPGTMTNIGPQGRSSRKGRCILARPKHCQIGVTGSIVSVRPRDLLSIGTADAECMTSTGLAEKP